ncbi:hypothetical protein JCM10908_006283 [Rhodotorula pacifica]|uniref:uncharacterized protein n=1 Tax=Rhodotorula pacifica TaxID=1495444 RepID=UPI003180EEA4
MAFSQNPQQQAAFVAHLQQNQQARGLPPLTPGQIAQLTAQWQFRQQQQQQAQQRQPVPAQAQPAQQQQQQGPPAGITSRERPLSDGDADHRSSLSLPALKQPTDRSLPLHFAPTTSGPGPTDEKLAPSLEALDQLASSYARLQKVERQVDWTLARKAHEVTEQAAGSAVGRGQPFKRTLRLHVTTTTHDQSWQLSPEQLAQQADPGEGALAEAVGEKPKTPRVDVRISGEVLEDPRYPSSSTPFTQFLHRLVLETPSRDPSTYPTGSQPLSWTRPPGPQSISSFPSAVETSLPTSSTLSLRLAVYLSHPAGERYSLHPELASVLDCAESDRVGVLEALWAYKKARGLVVEMGGGEANANAANGTNGAAAAAAGGGSIKSGIKTDERTANFFGNMGMVAFHHVPEYLNRWLMPPSPRLINLVVLVDPAAPAVQHTAYDLDLFVPDPSQPALEACARTLASLLSTPPISSSSSPSSSQTEAALLASLDAQIALDALSTTTHLRQLHALLAFTRDPITFLEHFVASQAGSLQQILGGGAGGRGGTIAPLGMEKLLGERWRDEIRRSENWEGAGNGDSGDGDKGWVEDAIAVWAMREKEGEALRARQQQQQAAAPVTAGGQYARR